MARAARIAVRVAIVAAIVGSFPASLEPFHAFKAVCLRVLGVALLAWFAGEISSRRARLVSQDWAALGWVAASALSTAFSLAPALSWLGEPSQREGLMTAVALAGLALGARRAHREDAHVRTTLTVMLVAGFVAAAHALLQLAGLDPLPTFGGHMYAAPGGVALRPASTLGNPILLGIVLAGLLPVALARLAGARDDAARLVPAAAAMALSLVATLSRGAWLAGAAGAVAASVLAWRAGARARRIAWTATLSLAPALVFALVRAPAAIAQRIAESMDTNALGSRELIAEAAARLWRERPWLGVGPDAFALAFPGVQRPEFWRAEWIGTPVHAHAVPLQVLATLGVVGVLAGSAWVITAAIAWRRAWIVNPPARLTLAAIAGALVALAVAGATNVVGLAGATLFAVLVALPSALEAHPEPQGSGGREWMGLLFAVLAITATPGVRELQAFSRVRTARDAPAREQLSAERWRALTWTRARDAQAATNLAPGEESLWRLASDAELAHAEALPADSARPCLVHAESAARSALRLVPQRAANHERLANVLAARALLTGSRATADSADASFARATELAPADGWLLVSWIRFHLAAHDGARAHPLAQRLVALYPEAAAGHAMAGAALLLLGRTDEAYAELKRAQAARWEEDAGSQRAEVDRLVTGLERGDAPSAGRP